MKKFMKTFAMLAGLALGGISLAGTAQASLIIDFSFDDPNQTVGTTDSIEMWATLSNDASSTESLVGRDFTYPALYNGTLTDLNNGPYLWDNGNLFNDISAIILAPGQRFKFLFGILNPLNGSVAAGTYRSPGAWLDFNGVEYGGYEINPFTVTVVDGSDVPAPGMLGLIALGLVMVGLGRRRA